MSSLVWFRRDLRLNDNAALSYATQNDQEVYAAFVFDVNILKGLKDKRDHRVYFIYQTLAAMNKQLGPKGAGVYLLYGDPVEEIPRLAQELGVKRVCANRDYEKYAKKRDAKVAEALDRKSISFETFKDHVIFESGEIRTKEGAFYKVFTPYSRAWLKALNSSEHAISQRPVDLSKMAYKRLKGRSNKLALKGIGFEPPGSERQRDIDPSCRLKRFISQIGRYGQERDLPALDSTSRLSEYLRFGNLSVREALRSLGKLDSEGKKTWLNELIWRDFYSGFLDTHNYVEKESYKYANVDWDNNTDHFNAWKEGRTGVPIVDAGMRQLNQTGWMHNRLRMVTGSYLTKIMLVDWKKGERYFGEKLIDYDLASNNGGWQWCASTGTDAAPYFRIFNPYTQAERFDKDAVYIKKFVPELRPLPPKYARNPELMDEQAQKKYGVTLGKDYPRPVANYKQGRKKALKLFKEAANGKT